MLNRGCRPDVVDLPCFPSFTETLVDVLHRCEGKQKRDVKLTCVSVFFLAPVSLSLCLCVCAGLQ